MRRTAIAALALALAWLAAGPLAAGSPRLELVFDRVNGTYEDLSPEFAPVDTGAVSLRLRSERNSVQLIAHRLALSPRSAGGHQMTVWAEFEAAAELEVELSVAGLGNALSDLVAAPRQRLAVSGAIDVEPLVDGYVLTVLAAPPVIELAVESQLGRRLVLLCEGLPLGGAGCQALDRALSKVRLPLPRPGEEFFLPASELLPRERRHLDRYLRATGSPRRR